MCFYFNWHLHLSPSYPHLFRKQSIKFMICFFRKKISRYRNFTMAFFIKSILGIIWFQTVSCERKLYFVRIFFTSFLRGPFFFQHQFYADIFYATDDSSGYDYYEIFDLFGYDGNINIMYHFLKLKYITNLHVHQ